MKKRVLSSLVFLLSLIMFSSFVFAACTADQRIMKLSAGTNAHGEIYSGIYSIEICFNEVFGYSYTGADPHLCTGTNKVVGLSANSNAHGEIPSLSNYLVDVCYGNLECSVRTTCNADENLIVSLSANTNAHFANDASYSTQICCKDGVGLEQAQWADMTGNLIDTADINDRVKLIVRGDFEGEDINFSIYRDVVLWFDEEVSAQGSDEGFTTWRADETGTYYFEATIVSTGEVLTSGPLEVVGPEDNANPVANILTPELGEIFLVNENVEFTQDSYDVDDFIDYAWDIGDASLLSGSIIHGSTRDYANYSITHSYSNTGQKNIFLAVRDERTGRDTDRTSILVIDLNVDGKYIFAHIKEPEWGISVYGKNVNFNASTTYAVEVLGGQISCIAGPCPSQTHSEVPVSNTPQGIESVSFNWTFSDFGTKSGIGLEGAVFTKPFSTPGPHWAKLTASVNPSSDAETQFSVYLDTPFCLVQDAESFWAEGDMINPSLDDCYREIGEPTQTCCPIGYSCEEDNGWTCQPSDEDICTSYETENECEDYSFSVAINDVESKTEEGFCTSYSKAISGNCWEIADDCRCVWNSTSDVCESAYDLNTVCGTGIPELNGTCIYSVSGSTECSGGYRHISWSARWTGSESSRPVNCVDGSKTIACVAGALLGFFSLFNFILSVSLIIVFYIFITKRKKR